MYRGGKPTHISIHFVLELVWLDQTCVFKAVESRLSRILSGLPHDHMVEKIDVHDFRGILKAF